MIFFDKVKHFFGIHKYYEIQRLGKFSHLLGCSYCKKKFAINTEAGILLPWDLELENFHRSMGHEIENSSNLCQTSQKKN